MEDSLESAQVVMIYLMAKRDWPQASKIAEIYSSRFDSWEMKTWLALCLSKMGLKSEAVNMLIQEGVMRTGQVQVVTNTVASSIDSGNWNLPRLDEDEKKFVLAFSALIDHEFEFSRKIAENCKNSPKKFALLGWLELIKYEFLLTRKLYSKKVAKRKFKFEKPKNVLEEARKHLEVSVNHCPDQLLGRLGLSLAQFHQMDFKNYSVNFSLAKNKIKNQSLVTYETTRFAISQNHLNSNCPPLQNNLLSIKNCFLYHLHAQPTQSTQNLLPSGLESISDLPSSLSFVLDQFTENFELINWTVVAFAAHFQSLRSHQKQKCQKIWADFANKLCLNLDFYGSLDKPQIQTLFENLASLFLLFRDTYTMRFVLKEGQKIFSPNEKTTVLSIFNMILVGNMEDALAALSMQSGASEQEKELSELYHLARFWALSGLVLQSERSNFAELAYGFRKSCSELEKIWRVKLNTTRNRPKCVENMISVRAGLGSIIYDQVFLMFSHEFSEQLLELGAGVRSYSTFYNIGSRLAFVLSLTKKIMIFTSKYFEKSEYLVRQNSIHSCAGIQTHLSRSSTNINFLGLETIFTQNCAKFAFHLKNATPNQFLEDIRHQKATRLDLNNEISFLLFEILALRFNADQNRTPSLIQKTQEIYQKKMNRNEYQNSLIQVISPSLLQAIQLTHFISKIEMLKQESHQPLKTSRSKTGLNSATYRHGQVETDVSNRLPSLMEEIRESDLHPGFQRILILKIHLFSGDYFKINSIWNKTQKQVKFDFWNCIFARKVAALGFEDPVNQEVELFTATLDRTCILNIIEHLKSKGDLNKLLYLLNFLTKNPGSTSIKFLIEFLKKLKSNSLTSQKFTFMPNHPRKYQKSLESLKIKDFFSVQQISEFKLCTVRLLTKLGRSSRAIDLCFESASNPELAPVFTLDLAFMLLQHTKFLESIQIFDLENYFIECDEFESNPKMDQKKQNIKISEYVSSKKLFKRMELCPKKRNFILTELQLVWRSLKGICWKFGNQINLHPQVSPKTEPNTDLSGARDPKLIQQFKNQNLFRKIDCLEKSFFSSLSLSTQDFENIIFRKEFEILSSHILHLSALNFNNPHSTNSVYRKAQKQTHLLYVYLYALRNTTQGRSKFEQTMRLLEAKGPELDVSDFLACYEAAAGAQRFGVLGSFWKYYNTQVQKKFRIYVDHNALFGTLLLENDFKILSDSGSTNQAFSGRSNETEALSPFDNQMFQGNPKPNLISSLGLPIFFPPINPQSQRRSVNRPDISTSRFRSELLNFESYDVSRLYHQVKLDETRSRGDQVTLKKLAKQMLKEEVSVSPTWSMLDCLLAKKSFQNSAQGFFKMMRKQARQKQPMTVLFAVGICLLRGGNLAELLTLLNAADCPQKILSIGSIVDLKSKNSVQSSDKNKNYSKKESLFIGSQNSLTQMSLNTIEDKENLKFDQEYVFQVQSNSLQVQSRSKQQESSFFKLYDQYVLKRKLSNPQVVFLLGVYFFHLKRLDHAAKCFVQAEQSPHFQKPSWLYLMDIALHGTGHNLYSNHFHKEKFIELPDFEAKNVKFVCQKMMKHDSCSDLSELVSLVSSFVDVYTTPQENKHNTQSIFNQFWTIASDWPSGSLPQCMALYFSTLILLKTKQIKNSKSKLKENLVKMKNLENTAFYGDNIFFRRCLILCADLLLSKEKVSSSLQLTQKSLSHTPLCTISKELEILVYQKGMKDGGKALACLESAVELTRLSEPNLAFRLGQKYLEQSQFAKAYHLSNQVLQKFPRFLQMKRQVLDPSQNALAGFL